jgi:hypothetical protein
MTRLLVLILSLVAITTAPAAQPLVADVVQELHGTFAGQPFWARLKPAHQQFGNHRVLELVYTPPAESELAGAHLSDCPFILVDQQLRVVAWNGRDSGSRVVPAAPSGYSVSRELVVVEGDDKRIDIESRTIPGERAWDLRIAPILLAIAWTRDGSAEAKVVDLFGPRHAEMLTISWKAGQVALAGTTCTATADANGRLATLAAADGTVLLTVLGRQ